MNQDVSRSSELPQPLRAVASGLRRLPGAGHVGRAAGGALDVIGAVSPRGRRMAVYTGAGALGVAGVVEWPVALTGAAVAWLTQPRPGGHPVTESPNGGAPADGNERHRTRAGAATGDDRGPAPEPSADQGPGDRLNPSRHRPEPSAPPVREQPAKVGDTETASALRQVAEATAHHDTHAAHHPGRNSAHDRHSG
ncbi:hypothetical protein ORI94_27215 [Streptomyces sp. NEAU-W12]|nr:hypothetical protein [Streptomyces sp. NEAU-W12]MCX2927141.1 hypothetical protein [Streptomyces sp. NEAU-W12]